MSLYVAPLFVLSLVIAADANACRMLEDFRESDKSKANVVFHGEVVDYKIVKPLEEVIVTYKVNKTIKGEKRDRWTIKLSANVNTSTPKSLKHHERCYGKKSEVGILSIPKKSDEPAPLVHGVCNPPYILSLPDLTQNGFCLSEAE